jgi:hypothetical protein
MNATGAIPSSSGPGENSSAAAAEMMYETPGRYLIAGVVTVIGRLDVISSSETPWCGACRKIDRGMEGQPSSGRSRRGPW